jgi:hypothetical protein
MQALKIIRIANIIITVDIFFIYILYSGQDEPLGLLCNASKIGAHDIVKDQVKDSQVSILIKVTQREGEGIWKTHSSHPSFLY